MIEEKAIVTRCEGKYIWVQTQRKSSCGHCSAKNTCGTSVLAKVLGNKLAHVRCLNPHHDDLNQLTLAPGDQVIIGLQESALLSGSLLVYLLPLVSMIFFGGLAIFTAEIILPEWVELASILASFSGLIMGLLLSKKIVHDRQQLFLQQDRMQENKIHQYEPVIIKKIPSSEWSCQIELIT